MRLDEVSKEAMYDVQMEIAEKLNVELSIEEIADVVSSQFKAADFAFRRNVEVRIPVFGSFVRKHGVEKGLAGQYLNSIRDIIGESAYQRQVAEAKAKNTKDTRARKAARLSTSITTLEELKKNAPVNKVVSKYDKL